MKLIYLFTLNFFFHFQVKNGFTTLIDTKMRVILTNTNCIEAPQKFVTLKPSPIYCRI